MIPFEELCRALDRRQRRQRGEGEARSVRSSANEAGGAALAGTIEVSGEARGAMVSSVGARESVEAAGEIDAAELIVADADIIE